MSYLIESPDGAERKHVEDLVGHEDWAVLAKGPSCRPVEHADWDEKAKRWRVDPERRARAERRAKNRCKSIEDLVDEIEALRARLDAAGIP